jgi:hypothetical protein
MQKLEFNQPLPWTNKQVYTWLIDAIDGIRFRDDIEYSSCCDPAGFINVQVNNLGVNTTAKWVDPQMGVGAQDLVVLFIHEARHNEIGGHTCGANDNSRAEMGAWAVQYYTFIYFADNLKDRNFLTIPTPPSLTGYYFDVARGNAEDTLKIRFCNDK